MYILCHNKKLTKRMFDKNRNKELETKFIEHELCKGFPSNKKEFSFNDNFDNFKYNDFKIILNRILSWKLHINFVGMFLPNHSGYSARVSCFTNDHSKWLKPKFRYYLLVANEFTEGSIDFKSSGIDFEKWIKDENQQRKYTRHALFVLYSLILCFQLKTKIKSYLCTIKSF